MTESEFVKNNRGISEGDDLPVDFLTGIYNRIVADEIKMDSSKQEQDSNTTSLREKRVAPVLGMVII